LSLERKKLLALPLAGIAAAVLGAKRYKLVMEHLDIASIARAA
jgi:hypothetical protein